MDVPRLRRALPIVIGVVSALGVVATIGLIGRAYALDEAEADRWLDHTHQVVETLLGLSAAVNTGESAARSYPATGDRALAIEGQAALDGAAAALRQVRELIRDNRDQQRRLDQLDPLLRRQRESAQGRLHWPRVANDPIIDPEGPQIAAVIRSLVADMIASERVLLEKRREMRERARERARLANIIRVVTSVVLLGAASVLLTQAILRGRRTARELGVKHGLLHSIIEGSADAIYVKDLDGRFILANSACARVLGRRVGEVLGKSLRDLVPNESGATITHAEQEILRRGINRTLEEVAELEGETRVFLTTKGPHRDRDQKIIGLIGISHEITDRRRLEEARLGEMNLHLRLGELLQACRTVDESYDVIGQLAPRFFPDEAGAVYLFQASRDHLEAQVVWGPDDPERHQPFGPDECWALRRGQQHLLDGRSAGMACRHAQSGTGAGKSMLCLPLLAHGEVLGVLHLRSPAPLTERVCQRAAVMSEQVALALANLQLRERLRNQSIRDPLTGLFNRRYTEETLARELHRAEREGAPLAVLAIDVDHFKRFNDGFGHDAGDLVLREIAGLLMDQTRGGDVASRMGGEELLVVLAGATLPQARVKAELIREAIKRLELRHLGVSLGPVTISVGVAAFRNGCRSDELLRAADLALYQAKREGRDRVVVESSSPPAPEATC